MNRSQKTRQENWQEDLEQLFADRVRFDSTECLLYSHDMGNMPSQVRGMVKSMPQAVVQPVSVEEVVTLVKLAGRLGLPLVPRGSGTSGYGGAVPARGGIVVDFVRMNKILAVDPAGPIVLVEPGVIWEDLEKRLAQEDLSLRTYPSSAPSSTVAGWVAQGGCGIGGYEYGFIRDNITAVQTVLPSGEVRDFTGANLALVTEAEGITGLITQVCLKVKPAEKALVRLASFATVEDLARTLQAVEAEKIPLWSVSFNTPRQVALQTAATPGQIHHLPEGKYLALFAFPAGRAGNVEKPLAKALNLGGGKPESEEAAREAWGERFYPMRLKRLGPSLVPTEVVLPVARLAEFLTKMEKTFHGRFAFEGTMVGPDKITLLGFLPADERKLAYPLLYTASLGVVEKAKQLGGQPFTTGMYFADDAGLVVGEERLQALWNFKRKVDPEGILNPGKVIPPRLDKNSPARQLLMAMRLAKAGKAVLSQMGLLMEKGEAKTGSNPIPAAIAREALVCAQCGYCRPKCTIFAASPWESDSPRGKYYLLAEHVREHKPIDEKLADKLFTCTTCKRCNVVCQTGIPIVENWLHIRPAITRKGYELSGLAQIRKNVLEQGNFWGLPNNARTAWLAKDIRHEAKGKVGYWPGCWASIVMPNMPQNTTRLLNLAGVDFVYLGEKETCCGLYLAAGGYPEDFAARVRQNLELFKERGIETLLLSCPGCYATFRESYPEAAKELGLPFDLKVVHTTEFFSRLITEGRLPLKKPVDLTATYHDSCHLGRWNGIYEEPRQVLRAMDGLNLVEMEHHHENALCCGLVCAFNSMGVVADAGTRRVREAVATHSDVMVTACAGCGSQFTATAATMKAPIRVRDFTDLLAEAAGLPVMDTQENIGQFMQTAVQVLKDSRIVRS